MGYIGVVYELWKVLTGITKLKLNLNYREIYVCMYVYINTLFSNRKASILVAIGVAFKILNNLD